MPLKSKLVPGSFRESERMQRTTIDFGIDLGTTNSSIAVLRGTSVEVIKNNLNQETTPSAVCIDREGALFVGTPAKTRLESDRENAFCEFRPQMGTAHEYRFARSGRVMKPEELSAEVLKSLKADVMQRTGEDIRAAVITVPAAFDLAHCKATQKAANLAGLPLSPLLLEPSAAAIAYGIQNRSDGVFWLIYDFSGGTFDAAVIQVRGGLLQIVNHGGDNHLGGKLIDWEILEQLVVPALLKQHQLTDFRRGNPKWNVAFGKLKLKVKEAKECLSQNDSTRIVYEYLCLDDRNQPVSFEYVLKRLDVERIAEPFIQRSINVCKKVLTEGNLKSGALEKVILVGGPTLMPYLRERLTDSKEGLGIALEFSKNPQTLFAQGAAIFAGAQRIVGNAPRPAALDPFKVSLDYKPIGINPEPLVGGQVAAPGGRSLSGYTIEFINAEVRPPWRSGKIGLSPDGMFVTNLWVEKSPPVNTFLIQLCDGFGTVCPVAPDKLTYTITTGDTPTDPPLIHSIGIAMPNNEVLWVIEKGTALPAHRKGILLKTTADVHPGQQRELFKLSVLEGENARADRNIVIGSLIVRANRIRQDLPAGSEVDLTIGIDKSRLVSVLAYAPLLNEEFEAIFSLKKKLPDPDALRKTVEAAKQRLANSREKTREMGNLAARTVLQRIEGERMVHDVEASLLDFPQDLNALDKCEKRLLDLNVEIDQLEETLRQIENAKSFLDGFDEFYGRNTTGR
jgi:molecular chaperone DnaK